MAVHKNIFFFASLLCYSFLIFNVEQCFPWYSVSLFHKISCGHRPFNGYCIYFSTALAAISWRHVYSTLKRLGNKQKQTLRRRFSVEYMWCVCRECIWQIFLFILCNFKEAFAAIHLSGTVIISGGHLQRSSIRRVLPFFEIRTWNRLCFQRYWVNSPPGAAIHSTNGPFSIIREQL